jgi:hypothetical protein
MKINENCQVGTSDFWHDLSNGYLKPDDLSNGYLKPENILKEGRDIREVNNAIEVIKAFESACYVMILKQLEKILAER